MPITYYTIGAIIQFLLIVFSRPLVNTLYPEKGPDFGVDDGHGWVRDPKDPEHSNFVFIGYYILQGLWTHREDAKTNNIMMGALRSLTMAYLITGDRKYGNPEETCNIALWSYRLAFNHPYSGKTMEFILEPPKDYPWSIC